MRLLGISGLPVGAQALHMHHEDKIGRQEQCEGYCQRGIHQQINEIHFITTGIELHFTLSGCVWHCVLSGDESMMG